MCCGVGVLGSGGGGGNAEAGDGGNILGPRAHAALLPAALNVRLADVDIAPPDQSAGTLRAAEFMRGDGQHVGAERRDVATDAPGSLHGVHMQQPLAAWTMAAISAIGWMTPVSLLASITEISGLSARAMALLRALKSTIPSRGDRQLSRLDRAETGPR